MSREEFIFAIIISYFVAIAVVFVFFPHKVVEFLGRFYRRTYKSFLNKPDEELDSMGSRWPNVRFFVGDFSEFIRLAPEEPKRFPRLIRYFRISGLFLLLFFGFMGVGILCAMHIERTG